MSDRENSEDDSVNQADPNGLYNSIDRKQREALQRATAIPRFPKLEITDQLKLPTTDTAFLYSAHEINSAFSVWSSRLNKQIEGIRKSLTPILREIRNIGKVLEPLASAFSQHIEAKNALRDAGLLPHKTVPWELFDIADPNLFAEQVEGFYVDRWAQIETEMLSSIDKYSINEEAKAGFRDIMSCHRHGLHRAAVCTAFPVLEAEFRRKFELGPNVPATSLKELRNAVGTAPLSIAMHRIETIDLIRTLDAHLFEQVKTPEAVARFLSDEVPNRHAAMHGLIEYGSLKNSLNAIILADHVLFMMSTLQDMVDEQGG